MQKRLFVLMSLSMALVIALMGLAAFFATRRAAIEQVDAQLKVSWGLVADALGEGGGAGYQGLVERLGASAELRVTLIGEDGSVLADSEHRGAAVPENHLHRPEVQQALSGGDGAAQRFSVTERQQMRYYARRFGTLVLRVSTPLSNLWGYTQGAVTVILGSAALALLLTLLFTFLYTRGVMRPLGAWTAWAAQVADDPLNPPARPAQGSAQFTQPIQRVVNQLSATMLKLSSQTAELDAILSGMSSGLIALNERRGVVVMNRQARAWFQVGKFVPGTDLLVLTQQPALGQLLQGQGEVQLGLGGSQVLARWMPIAEGTGELWGLIFMEDVTEQRGAEIMRREFASNVSHEMRTPLTAIQGCADSLRAPALADGEKERLLDMIGREVSWLSDLMRDLLTLSRVESMYKDFERETLRLRDVVGDAARAAGRSAREKGVTIDAADVADVNVFANYARLRQLISNLVDNAVRYNVPGGSVTIRARALGGTLRLSVSDSGIGIPKDKQARVFERFYRVDDSHSRATLGTGLGLSIVKHMVRLYNGTIELTSCPGSTTFEVALPIVEGGD